MKTWVSFVCFAVGLSALFSLVLAVAVVLENDSDSTEYEDRLELELRKAWARREAELERDL